MRQFMNQPVESVWVRGALLALAYFVTAQIGLQFALVGHAVTLFWPPSGIALAAILLMGNRYLPAVFVGAFFSNLTSGLPVWAVTGMAAGATLEAWLGAWLLMRFSRFNLRLSEVRDIYRLVLFGGALSTLSSALIGPMCLLAAGAIPATGYAATAVFWWMGDALGIILFLPALMAYVFHKPLEWTRARRLELLALMMSMLLLTLVVFGYLSSIAGSGHVGLFMLFPLVVWAALSFNQRCVSGILIMMFVVAVLFTLNGFGPFANHGLRGAIDLWLYTIFLTVLGVSVSALNYQRNHAMHLEQESERRLQEIMDMMPAALFVKDSGSNILLMNRACEEFWGVKLAAVRGTTGSPLFPQEQIDEYIREDQDAIASGHAINFEKVVWHAGLQQCRTVHIFKKPVFGADGAPLYLVSLMTDVTEGRRNEESLRRTDASLRAMLDNLPYLAWLKDAEGRFVAVNKAFVQTTSSASEAEIIGKTDADLWPRELADKYQRDDREVIKTHRQKLTEELAMDRGEIVWMETFKAPILDDAGEVIGTTGMARDITDRKHEEAEVRLAAKVFESSGEAIVITDDKVNIVAVNLAFTEMSGYRASEVIGRNPKLLASGRHDQAFYADMWDEINQHGVWQGEIWDKHKSGRVYPKWMSITAVKDKAGNISNYISVARDITEYKEAEKNIQFLAYYDVLTGLPNRSLMRDRLGQLIASAHRDRQTFALLFLDLDRFKYINDSMGHSVGDRLLQEVGQRIQECVREGDTVSRIGGDEFIVLLRETSAEGAEQVAKKLLPALSAPYELGGQTISTQASVGISLYPEHARDADTLIKNADVAMYRAKDKGRNNYQFFAPEMNFHVDLLFSMEKDIRTALERGEFSLHYQPQVDLSTGKMCGVEALLRWKHPEKGMISPAEFIPVAEETGQIVAIGEWVIQEACHQRRAWHDQRLGDFVVAVNLSIRQLRQPSFLNFISSKLEESGIQPDELELEITEGIMMGDVEGATQLLEAIHKLGVRLSIDDFGTGFSSLNYLKRLPLDKLKIDQSFVHDIETDQSDAAIVRSVISLGHRLDLRVIAEGVETLEQLDFLRIRGCDEIQGYFYSRPMPAADLAIFARNPPALPDSFS